MAKPRHNRLPVKLDDHSLYTLVGLKNYFMIIVHDIFVCKPGNASKLAKLFKEVMANDKELVNIMTDMTGSYNKVVVVTNYDNLTAYEESWKKYEQNTEEMKKMQEKMAGYHEMYLTGSREIYRVW
jgi:hypothetical protein